MSAFAGLLERAGRGDPAALAEVLDTWYPRVARIVHRELARDFRLQHRELLPVLSTGDVVQEVFLDVVRRLGTVTLDNEEAWLAYLSTAVRHRVLKIVRYWEATRRDRRNAALAPGDGSQDPAEPTDPEPSPGTIAALDEQVQTFQEVLQTFPERTRLLLQLRLRDEATFPVIAHQLGFANEETARQSFVQAHARLLVRLRGRGMRGSHGA